MSGALRIGLTGGIGSGKSTVSRMFEGLGVPVIDTDVIAREIVAPGTPVLAEIAAAFGEDVLDRDGRLRRDVLRGRVFEDPHARERLEAITHPRIYERVRARVREVSAPYCIIVIPLLVERARPEIIDRVLVVDARPEDQIRRVTARDDLTEADVRAIMRNQATRAERLAAADDTITNDGATGDLRRQVESLHRAYLDRCRHLRSG